MTRNGVRDDVAHHGTPPTQLWTAEYEAIKPGAEVPEDGERN